MTACTCEHISLCHRYDTATRANDGKCLAPQCWCEGFEESS